MLALRPSLNPVYTPELRDAERGNHSDGSLYLLGSVTHPSDTARLIAHIRPDILVVDLRLTGLAGVAVLEYLHASMADLRVIVMNDKPDPRLRDVCLGLGARFFFHEQDSFEQVRAAVAVLLNQRNAARHAA